MIVLICITAYVCFSYCILIGLISIIICVGILLASLAAARAPKPVRKHATRVFWALCVLCLLNFSPKPFHVFNVFIFFETNQTCEEPIILKRMEAQSGVTIQQ
jgi:hypothetical protein